MQRKLCLALVLGWSVLLQACGQSTDKAYAIMLQGIYSYSVPLAKPADVQRLQHLKQPPVLLDTRTPEEFQVSHLKGARFVGYDTFSPELVKDILKDAPLVVYCSVGYRSEKIGEKLLAAGYKNVRNLYGGLFEWVNSGQPVYNAKGKTAQVHAYSRSWGVWLQKGEKVYGPE